MIIKSKGLYQVNIHVAVDPASSAASSLFGARFHAKPSWLLLEVCVGGSLKWCVANMVCRLHGVLSQPVPREYLIPSIPIGKCGTIQMTRGELATIVQPLELPTLAESAFQSRSCSSICQVT